MKWSDCKDAHDRRAWKEERRDEALQMAQMFEGLSESHKRQGEATLAARDATTGAGWRREYERLKAITL